EANLAVNISQLRKVLGDDESGEQFIETVPKRGYRFAAQVTTVLANRADLIVHERTRSRIVVDERETDDDEEAQQAIDRVARSASAVAVLPSAPAKSIFWHRRAVYVLLLTSALVLAAVGYFINAERTARSRMHAGTRTLAILPFRNLKDDRDTDFLGISLADAIITKLDYVSTIIVRPSSYMEKYRNRDIDPKAAAAELHVNTLLTGSFIKDGDDLRINAQLVDVESNEILWRDSIDVKYEKLITLQDRVARQVIEGMKLKLSPSEDQRLNLDTPHNSLAYEYYLRGVDLYSKNEFSLAIEMFKKSVALDSAYALAWAHLGTAYTADAAFRFGGREDYQRALEAYQRALALNAEQIEARVFMANMLTDTNRVVQAVPLLREVLKVNPNYALAHWELGYAYRFTGMLDESIAECERARAIDPQVKLHSSALNSYLYAGRYDKFLHSLPPDEDAFILFYRGLARQYLKDDKGAAADFDRAYQLDPSLYTEIGRAFSLGLGSESRKGIELLKGTETKMDARGVTDAEAMYKIAQAYAVLGDKSSAFRMLSRSIKGGFFCYPYIKDDPFLDNLRPEAEYADLLDSARKSHEDFKSRFF
ncbi:MAG TPA: winged helix-turn-helix domain-containing protein, partial [Pyrinomonadaceae bacterium]|nr:winged helix-turn-helix domain-containing protein [Pyrinomonadaceae bacterium]